MNNLVKILFDDDGAKNENRNWHLVQSHGDATRTVCTGEVFGEGEGSAVYKKKQKEKGGITCPGCIRIIKWYKNIKL